MGWLLSFFTGPIISALGGQILAFYQAKLAAVNNQDAQAVDLAKKEIEAEIAARANAKEIIIAEQGRWWTAAVRPLIVLPFGIYIWKVVLYDVVMGAGTTDALRGDVATLMMVVVGSYFGGRTIEKVAQIFKR